MSAFDKLGKLLDEYAMNDETHCDLSDDTIAEFKGVRLTFADAKEIIQNKRLSLRDYFAGEAMQGYLSGRNNAGMVAADYIQDAVAKTCYEIADAMLKARVL